MLRENARRAALPASRTERLRSAADHRRSLSRRGTSDLDSPATSPDSVGAVIRLADEPPACTTSGAPWAKVQRTLAGRRRAPPGGTRHTPQPGNRPAIVRLPNGIVPAHRRPTAAARFAKAVMKFADANDAPQPPHHRNPGAFARPTPGHAAFVITRPLRHSPHATTVPV